MRTCEVEDKLTQRDILILEQGIKEIEMKKDNFESVLGIMRELENNESSIVEQMFLYKLNEKEENYRESKKVTKEYHNGALDPHNSNSKYEQRVK
jgi:hypothetical protein